MRHRTAILLGGLVVASAPCTTARAQDVTDMVLARSLPAPARVLELNVGTGYAQGFGRLAPDRTVADASGAGIGLSAALDYRLDPVWSVGLEGRYQEYEGRENTSSRGVVLDAGATYHFQPVQRADPWLRLGAGFRSAFESDPSGAAGVTVARYGFELVAAKLGYDVRILQDVAIAPVVGADLDLFVWSDGSGGTPSAMPAAQAAVFVYAGLQGRFDLGMTRPSRRDAEIAPIGERLGVTALQPGSPMLPAPRAEPLPSAVLDASAVALQKCKQDLESIDRAPRFEGSSTELRPVDYDVLRRIAVCFTIGPLRMTPLRLVGRTDGRGSVAHNLELGRERAARVAVALQLLGVDADRIEVTSRGSLDARGSDETSRQHDRRVDIVAGTATRW